MTRWTEPFAWVEQTVRIQDPLDPTYQFKLKRLAGSQLGTPRHADAVLGGDAAAVCQELIENDAVAVGLAGPEVRGGGRSTRYVQTVAP